mgnify:CR=1 FL=1
MAVGDEIFVRLRKSTDAELLSIQNHLHIKSTGDRETDIIHISRELRKQVGDGLLNLLRDEHELSYREILRYAARFTAKEAGWRSIEIPDIAENVWIEDYIIESIRHATNPSRKEMSEAENARVRIEAESLLRGPCTKAKTPPESYVYPVLVGGGLLLSTFLTLPVSITFSLGFTVSWIHGWAKSDIKNALPAILLLIHIRRRGELEIKLNSARI